jgi:hypothetical protein
MHHMHHMHHLHHWFGSFPICLSLADFGRSGATGATGAAPRGQIVARTLIAVTSLAATRVQGRYMPKKLALFNT